MRREGARRTTDWSAQMNQISWSDPQPRQMRVQEETTSSEVLGHIVDENGIRADPRKCQQL